ncbi:SHOCT domain-containing protein [Metaclostridioides mangenotii]|uniref:SHOCT domain-containing protein n=1 Tax=Metaclostridioides mangenotii TaxID=1540 RepID=UPI0026ED1E4A|nr:SHOCT domain-containing protein [Clostridioides mangenotii]
MALFGKKEVCIFCGEEKKAKLNVPEGGVCKKCVRECTPVNDIVNGLGASISKNKKDLTKQDLLDLKIINEQLIKEGRERIAKNEEKFNNFRVTSSVPMLFEIDERKRQWTIPKLQLGTIGDRIPSKIYSFEDILEFELLEDGDTVTKGGLGSAVVGGALFGGTGAVVGSVTGKKTTKKLIKSLKIKITINDLSNPTEYIELIKKDTKTDSKEYKKAYETAQEILSMLTNMKNNHKTTKDKEIVSENNQPEVSNLEQIKTLKELLDIGAITEDEFNTKKKELLGI